MSELRTSIIVPVYKTPPVLLRNFLHSALSQTSGAIELIAVDDASPDECPKILDDVAQSDSRMRVIHRRSNGRAGVARNDGLDVARGEYVLFADADDVMRDDMCATLVAKARECDADIVQGSWFDSDAEGNVLREHSLPERSYNLSRSRDRSHCLRNLQFMPWGKLFRREALGNLRFETFEVNIGEDTLFNVAALCRVKRMVTTAYMGYGYTVHEESATGRAAKGMPYLRTIIDSDRRIREVLVAEDGSDAAQCAADWLTLKRFATGCEWIASHPDHDEKRLLWHFWRQHLTSGVLPSLTCRGVLAASYRLVSKTNSPAVVFRFSRFAGSVFNPASIFERAKARIVRRVT